MIMGPYLMYFSLVNFVYPIKQYLGETGCYLVSFLKNMGIMGVQLQSFFMALFRYVCLFHDSLLFKYNISPHVSKKFQQNKIKEIFDLKLTERIPDT